VNDTPGPAPDLDQLLTDLTDLGTVSITNEPDLPDLTLRVEGHYQGYCGSLRTIIVGAHDDLRRILGKPLDDVEAPA
jgi:hypothetical protein